MVLCIPRKNAYLFFYAAGQYVFLFLFFPKTKYESLFVLCKHTQCWYVCKSVHDSRFSFLVIIFCPQAVDCCIKHKFLSFKNFEQFDMLKTFLGNNDFVSCISNLWLMVYYILLFCLCYLGNFVAKTFFY